VVETMQEAASAVDNRSPAASAGSLAANGDSRAAARISPAANAISPAANAVIQESSADTPAAATAVDIMAAAIGVDIMAVAIAVDIIAVAAIMAMVTAAITPTTMAVITPLLPTAARTVTTTLGAIGSPAAWIPTITATAIKPSRWTLECFNPGHDCDS